MSRVHPADVYADTFVVPTAGRGFIDIGTRLQAVVANSGMHEGLVQVFVQHTSCSVLLAENADPEVRADLERFLARLLPEDDASARQADDMPAHVRSMLTGVSVCVPLAGGRLALGTHQGVFLWEHRQVLRRRCVTVTVVGH